MESRVGGRSTRPAVVARGVGGDIFPRNVGGGGGFTMATSVTHLSTRGGFQDGQGQGDVRQRQRQRFGQ